MAETTKKFLDFTGLQKYDELLKAKVAKDIKVVKDDLDTRLVKNVAASDTITWTSENGTYTASVKGVVLDNADYALVKTNATQSASAWSKFLEGITNLYPDNVAPALKDLATKKETTDALASAKSYADGLAVNYDSKGSAAQALVDAKAYTDSKVDGKFDAIGSAEAAKTAAIQAAKDYADATFDTKGSAATAKTEAIQAAKEYADGAFDTKGSAEAAKTAAISAANTYTNTEIGKVNDKIAAINTSIAGGVHFRGVVAELPGTPFTGYTNGDIVIVGNKEYILNKPTEGEGAWVELGDTTAESQRITNLEGNVSTLMGADTVEGSVAKALKDAKAFTTKAIDDLVGDSGQVGKNTAAIATLNGDENIAGSVKKALKDAKAYTDTKKKEATDYTDSKIIDLVNNGQVKTNTDAITTLNADSSTVGSVDYKIAQAVANIEASIETITEAEITGLFSK